ncbi:MAG: hypothetical protein M3Y58_16285 [Chloroflexota bacterium]|nr:hypothetical protein [Chloroflexota bacterium]
MDKPSDMAMNVLIWLVLAAISLGGIVLLFIAITKEKWLLLIPALPLFLIGSIIRDKMNDARDDSM